jgi:hypothetical protein
MELTKPKNEVENSRLFKGFFIDLVLDLFDGAFEILS